MTTTPSVPTAYDAWKAAAAPQPTLLRLLAKALEEASQLEAADAYLEAAANALVLAWAKQARIGPSDDVDFEDAPRTVAALDLQLSCGDPPPVMALLDLHPQGGGKACWRQTMAAEALAGRISRALARDPAKAMNGLTALASALGEPVPIPYCEDFQVTGRDLAELALEATGCDFSLLNQPA
jgi:hypothetical protein